MSTNLVVFLEVVVTFLLCGFSAFEAFKKRGIIAGVVVTTVAFASAAYFWKDRYCEFIGRCEQSNLEEAIKKIYGDIKTKPGYFTTLADYYDTFPVEVTYSCSHSPTKNWNNSILFRDEDLKKSDPKAIYKVVMEIKNSSNKINTLLPSLASNGEYLFYGFTIREFSIIDGSNRVSIIYRPDETQRKILYSFVVSRDLQKKIATCII